MHPSTAYLAPLILLSLAACSSESSSTNDRPTPVTNDGGPEPGADAGPITVARSSVGRTPASSVSASSLAAAVAANNAFAVDLLARASAGSTSNLITSPLSASLALTMTYAGAEGDTATQMASALHFGDAGAAIFDGQNALDQALLSRVATALAIDPSVDDAGAPNDQFQLVNSVWGQEGYVWAPAFLDTLASSYGTGVYEEDFADDPAAALQTINTWVSDETAGKIQNLLTPAAVNSGTAMVLVNAVHVKFPWTSTFDPNATVTGTFTRADATTVQAPLMNQQANFSYVDDGAAQIVGLPLTGGLGVVIALPHGDLATYESTLTAGSAGIAWPSKSALVALELPKATFTSPTFSLKSPLEGMGMTDAFTKGVADFQGMCATPAQCAGLYVSDVLQKTELGMQETGIEAAAATAVVVEDASAVFIEDAATPTPIPMNVTHPYLVSIVDVATGAVLFLGQITDPTNAGGT